MTAKKRSRPDGPRWRAFMQAAWKQVAEVNGFDFKICPALSGEPAPKDTGIFPMQPLTVNPIAVDDDVIHRVAAQIVAHGDGPAFLKAVRRGRATQRQNIRYRLLREVELLAGDSVKRRRVTSNIPDALALKPAGEFKLEAT